MGAPYNGCNKTYLMDGSSSRSDASNIGVSSPEVERVGESLCPRRIMEISMEVGSSVQVVFDRHFTPLGATSHEVGEEGMLVEDVGEDGSVCEKEALTVEACWGH